jgi:hypothetical protein
MQTSATLFNLSVTDHIDSNSNAGNALSSPFWINLETVGRKSGDSSDARQAIDVDVDAMQPGSTTVAPVGAALIRTN